jgi:uncharacterized membrane protein
MQYVLIICTMFTFTVSLLFGMELVTGTWEYSMESSFIAMFVFMLMTGIFMLGVSECSTKLRK